MLPNPSGWTGSVTFFNVNAEFLEEEGSLVLLCQVFSP